VQQFATSRTCRVFLRARTATVAPGDPVLLLGSLRFWSFCLSQMETSTASVERTSPHAVGEPRRRFEDFLARHIYTGASSGRVGSRSRSATAEGPRVFNNLLKTKRFCRMACVAARSVDCLLLARLLRRCVFG